MNQDKAVRPDRMSDRAGLLDSAGRQAFWTLRDPGGQSAMVIAHVQRFGFADLLAALRRVRTEVARHSSNPRKRAPPASPKKHLGDGVVSVTGPRLDRPSCKRTGG